MAVKIVIPTYQTYDKVKDQIQKIRETMTVATDVIATCRNASAAKNRNIALDYCDYGDTVIMLDDDIEGFTPGWDEALIAPLVAGAIMSSARLMTKEGHPGPQIGAEDRNGLETYEAIGGAVPSACIAFKKDDLIFDENYEGAGWEDTDFCRQKKLKYPNGQIVITNKCRIVHRLETKHEGGDTKNGVYFKEKWENNLSLDCLIFTRDRPMQLELLLRSIRMFMPTLHNRIHILYSYTEGKYAEGYDVVARKYRNIHWVLQSDFIVDFRNIVDSFSKPYCLMLVDDGIFIRAPNMLSLLSGYVGNVATASLRLSPSAKYCTPARKDMTVPRLALDDENVYIWNYTKCDRFTDWGYPHGIDGNIYRTPFLKEILNDTRFCPKNPNEAEAQLITRIPEDKPYMLCEEQTSWLLISANRVAAGNTPFDGQSTKELNDALLDGKILQHSWAGKENLPEVNICSPYVILEPKVGIHFFQDGKMHGCFKVWKNLIKGFEKLGIVYSNNQIERYNGCINAGAPGFENLPRSTIVGPETMVATCENYKMWRNFDFHVAPCEWVVRSWQLQEPAKWRRIGVWPSGIDTEQFNDVGWKPEYDCLIYKKHVNLSEIEVGRRVDEVKKFLDEHRMTYRELEYGQYREDQLIQASKEAKFFAWIAGTESNNIALMEVLASGVPVYVWDTTRFSYVIDAGSDGGIEYDVRDNAHAFGYSGRPRPANKIVMDGASSAPYFDERCGVKHIDFSNVDSFIDRLSTYRPREFVQEMHSLEKNARIYYRYLTGGI